MPCELKLNIGGYKKSMENKDNKEVIANQGDVIKKKKVAKKFSKITASVLILVTVVFCLFLTYMLSEFFLTVDGGERISAQLTFDKKQVEKSPNDPAKRVQLGFSYFRDGDESAAIEQYRNALNLDKNYYPAILNLAIVYDAMDKPNKSLEYATRAAKLAPNDYKPQMLKAISYRKLELYSKSEDAFSKAVELSSDNASLLYEIGYLQEVQKKYKEALEAYNDALSFDPMLEDALEGAKRMKDKLN